MFRVAIHTGAVTCSSLRRKMWGEHHFWYLGGYWAFTFLVTKHLKIWQRKLHLSLSWMKLKAETDCTLLWIHVWFVSTQLIVKLLPDVQYPLYCIFISFTTSQQSIISRYYYDLIVCDFLLTFAQLYILPYPTSAII